MILLRSPEDGYIGTQFKGELESGGAALEFVFVVSWEDVPHDAFSYLVKVSDSILFDNIVFTKELIEPARTVPETPEPEDLFPLAGVLSPVRYVFLPNNLLANTTYFWKVEKRNSVSEIEYSSEISIFHTTFEAPILSVNSTSTTIGGSKAIVQWESITNEDVQEVVIKYSDIPPVDLANPLKEDFSNYITAPANKTEVIITELLNIDYYFALFAKGQITFDYNTELNPIGLESIVTKDDEEVIDSSSNHVVRNTIL